MNRPLAGVLWMLASGVCFVGVTGVVRSLGTDVPAQQAAFLRFLWAVAFLTPALIALLRRGMPAGTWKFVGLRGIVHTAAVIFWFYAMARIPVAEVTAIGYVNPVIVTVGAAFFFGEKLAFRRIAAIGVAIIGTLIVLRPGLREIEPGHLAQIAAAICFAGSYLIAKRLSDFLPAASIVALMSLSTAVMLLPLALAVWVPVTVEQVLWLGLVAAFATTGHYCMTRAFAVAPVSVTQPVTFLQLVWASILGAAVFGEAVDLWVLVGGGLILGGVSYITWREAALKRAGVTPAVNATKT